MSVTLEDDDDETLAGLGPDGRPDPAYASALGLVAASGGRRSLAFAIDAAIVGVLALPLLLGALPLWLGLVDELAADPASILTDPDFSTGLIFYLIGQGLVSVVILIQLILHGVRGVTIGKAILGLRSVNVARFTKPGFWRVLIRAVVFWGALALVPVIGGIPFLLSPLWDRQRRGRGWLDIIGGNWLIDARRGLDPFDRKALRHARRRVAAPAAAKERPLPSLATSAAGAVPVFVPAGRSSSGVIAANRAGDQAGVAWTPPPVGVPKADVPPTQTSAPRRDVLSEPSLIFDDGLHVAVIGPGLIGRNPEAGADEAVTHLLALTDDSRQLSKTHAGFGTDERGLWVIDRGSSNGTTVTLVQGQPKRLEPWQREYLDRRAVVEIGGRRFTANPPRKNGDDV